MTKGEAKAVHSLCDQEDVCATVCSLVEAVDIFRVVLLSSVAVEVWDRMCV